MVQNCFVESCGNSIYKPRRCINFTPKTRISFYQFPKASPNVEDKREIQQLQRMAWYHAINRKNKRIDEIVSQRICSEHFVSGKVTNY